MSTESALKVLGIDPDLPLEKRIQELERVKAELLKGPVSNEPPPSK